MLIITPHKADKRNIWSIARLKVHDEQQGFVATNTESILQAYTTMTEGDVTLLFGIYDEESLIGFVTFGYEWQEESDPPIAQNNYLIWRFMIDKAWQGKGLGKQTLQTSTDFVKTMPCGKTEFIWLSYEVKNTAARASYYAAGFHENNESCGGGAVAVLQPKEAQQYGNTRILGILSGRGTSSPLPPHINQEALHSELIQTLADSQLKLVPDNIKRVTASNLYTYEVQQERLSQINDSNILTDQADTPLCVIKTTAVTILPFHRITFALCMREGEDDILESQQKTHHVLFIKEGNALDHSFCEDMPTVLEDFEVVYR